MDKKSYLIIGVTIFVFAIIIISILLFRNNNDNWTSDILNSQQYQMTMTDCNGRKKELDKNTLTSLNNKWNTLSNNGPWTGDDNACYTTLTISYETGGIVNQKEILIIDDSSIAFIETGNSIYYTNANEIINDLNLLFISD